MKLQNKHAWDIVYTVYLILLKKQDAQWGQIIFPTAHKNIFIFLNKP